MATDVATRNCYPILPCPFCGYQNVNVIAEKYVDCPSCKAYGPDGDGKDNAIVRWNAASRPIATPLPDVVDLVKSDIDTRKEFGLKQYGVPLKPFNGKKSLQECYEELLDAAFYLRQEIYERNGK